MKAEEILNKKLNEIEWGISGTKDTTFEIVESMKEYARQKCKEQREICSEYAWDKWDSEKEPYIQKSVRNAPEPEFE